MSLIELRLLTAIAVRNKCVLKCGDVKQAFVQAIFQKMKFTLSGLLDVASTHIHRTGDSSAHSMAFGGILSTGTTNFVPSSHLFEITSLS